MADASKPKFIFESKGVDKNTFSVVRFKGTEGLSTIYRFSIMLISEKDDLDIGAILQNPAEFIIKRADGDIPFKGMLSSFEQLHQVGKMCFYRAELVPKLWWATLTHCNQIFLNEGPKGFLGDVLKKAGLQEGLGFDFKLQGAYPSWEYVCQYDESHFNFISRWMERDGMYYYFEQTDQGEKMVITDTHIAHSPMKEGTSLIYSPPSNLDHAHREEVVKNFMLKQQPMPQKVLLKDYNYRKPSLEMKGEAVVSAQGMGEIYIYGEHFKTPDEGKQLAQIRAQEFLCREKVFHGVSTVPYVRTGYIFELKDHYRQDFNQRYLTTEVLHEGSQEAYLVSGLGLNLAEDADRLYYRNSFTCIPAQTQFRAERKAVKPKFSGSLNARVDASGSGKYAELDEQGRYKVIMPFDESGRNGGKATTWLRMAQPYGGANHGMHFPLHKDTEVLITCIDGDPDRPLIQSAAPNPENPSLVKDSNQTMCLLTTGGENRIHAQDRKGSEGLLMSTPHSNSFVRMGAVGSDNPGDKDKTSDKKADNTAESKDSDGIKICSDKDIKMFGYNFGQWVYGDEFKVTTGGTQDLKLAEAIEVFLGFKQEFSLAQILSAKIGGHAEFKEWDVDMTGEEQAFKAKIDKLVGDQTKLSVDVTDLKAAKRDMSGKLTTLRGDHDKLEVAHNSLKGETKKLVGESSKLAGEVENLAGSMTSLSGEITELCGEVTSLAGGEETVIGENTKLIGEVTKAIGETSEVSAESSKISGEMNNIAGLISNI